MTETGPATIFCFGEQIQENKYFSNKVARTSFPNIAWAMIKIDRHSEKSVLATPANSKTSYTWCVEIFYCLHIGGILSPPPPPLWGVCGRHIWETLYAPQQLWDSITCHIHILSIILSDRQLTDAQFTHQLMRNSRIIMREMCSSAIRHMLHQRVVWYPPLASSCHKWGIHPTYSENVTEIYFFISVGPERTPTQVIHTKITQLSLETNMMMIQIPLRGGA